jgi:hypothetical protein
MSARLNNYSPRLESEVLRCTWYKLCPCMLSNADDFVTFLHSCKYGLDRQGFVGFRG